MSQSLRSLTPQTVSKHSTTDKENLVRFDRGTGCEVRLDEKSLHAGPDFHFFDRLDAAYEFVLAGKGLLCRLDYEDGRKWGVWCLSGCGPREVRCILLR